MKKPRRAFLRVIGWERLQPKHSGRRFPWIRLYDDLIDDPRYRSLSPKQRADLIDLMLLANRRGNMVPDDPAELAFSLRSKEPVDTETLISAGFVCRQRAGKRPANGRQATALDEMRLDRDKEENRLEKESVAPDKSGALLQEQQDQSSSGSKIICLVPCSDSERPLALDRAALQRLESEFPEIANEVHAEVLRFVEHVKRQGPPTQANLPGAIRGWIRKGIDRRRALGIVQGVAGGLRAVR